MIALNGITVERGGKVLLADIDWTVLPGQNWVILGPNGAGKTTLLNLITAYLWPTAGHVHVLGQTLGEVDVRQLRRTIAVVSDSIGAMINRDLSAYEVLVTGARAHLNLFEAPSRREHGHAMEMAEAYDLVPLLEKPYGVLSTGERQRLVITRALMTHPRVVVLDEPCAGLDLAARELVLRTVEQIAHGPSQPSVLLTTHHVEEITPAFSHGLLLRDGRQFAAGGLGAMMTSANMTQLFGLPVTVRHRHGRWSAHVDGRVTLPPSA